MFYSFIYAAFPWVVLGLSIAVAATYISEKYQDKGEKQHRFIIFAPQHYKSTIKIK